MFCRVALVLGRNWAGRKSNREHCGGRSQFGFGVAIKSGFGVNRHG